ncbi:hypothetical protein F4604DRAFT_1676465 [Suillus subluteus]|nr:hypothetical protein F4604DRAFT_1676465 [Suillus subluteus]
MAPRTLPPAKHPGHAYNLLPLSGSNDPGGDTKGARNTAVECSKDLRTPEEIQGVIPWAKQIMARYPYIPPKTITKPKIGSPTSSQLSVRDAAADSIVTKGARNTAVECSKDLRTPEEIQGVIPWAKQIIARYPYTPPKTITKPKIGSPTSSQLSVRDAAADSIVTKGA